MSLIEYSKASDYFGPQRPDINTVETLGTIIDGANKLLYLITHPRYRGIYAQVDPHLNISVLQAVKDDVGNAVVMLDGKLVVLFQKTSHWHVSPTRSKVIAEAKPKAARRLMSKFDVRVAALMASVDGHALD